MYKKLRDSLIKDPSVDGSVGFSHNGKDLCQHRARVN